MEAIRGAGGAGSLKPAKKTSRKDPPKVPQDSSNGGDLMADLASKLVMRRKGISGAKEATSTTFSRQDSSSEENDSNSDSDW